MLPEEARWIGTTLADLPDTAFPLVNVGSQTRQFRTEVQPWIDREVFARLRDLGRVVVHADLQDADGVDMVIDVTSPSGQAQLAGLGVRSVLCSNLLEHVTDPWGTLDALLAVCPTGGVVVLTGPERYPHHPDPIDNGFRPTWSDIATRIEDRADVMIGTRIVGDRFLADYLRALRSRLGSGRVVPNPDGAGTGSSGLSRTGWVLSRLWWLLRRPVNYALVLSVR